MPATKDENRDTEAFVKDDLDSKCEFRGEGPLTLVVLLKWKAFIECEHDLRG